ncbi:MAG: inorganic diphosphatase [Desulfuromonas sp.]|nr:MAG: inorganic diphosphatase [Desulfuromonas sp.]
MTLPAQIYVIGHRNPDTDSVCSAIAYADLRRRQGLKNVRPARAGTLNRQTEFVLDHLQYPVPELLTDVYPRVRDVVTEQVVTVSGEAPLAEALKQYHQHNIRMLPVVDVDNCALGMLLLKKASEQFLLPDAAEDLRCVHVSVNAIVRCLRAKLLCSYEADSLEHLDLYVGGRSTGAFQQWVGNIASRRSILIAGDRPHIQRMAIEAGVRVLIVSGGSVVSPDLIDLARRHRVSVVSSTFDTASCSWLTRLATPVRSLVDGSFLSARRDDLLDDLRTKLLHGGHAGAIVLDDEDRVSGVATKSHLIRKSPLQLILVDHNELSQAVPGADKVEILEVVDHHRLGNFHTDTPIHFINQPLGSTCTLVARLFRQSGHQPDEKIAGLLLSGLLSDTVLLKSPTTTDVDRDIAEWLSTLSGLDLDQYGAELFASGSVIASGQSARQLILGDFKEYQVESDTLGLGQVEVVNLHSFQQRKEELLAELARLRDEKGYLLAALLVTDIVEGNSLLVTSGPNELPYMIRYPQVEKNIYRLNGVLSRKKQLVPHLLKVFKVAG